MESREKEELSEGEVKEGEVSEEGRGERLDWWKACRVNVAEGRRGKWSVKKFSVKERMGHMLLRYGGRYVPPGEYTMLSRGGETVMSDTPAENAYQEALRGTRQSGKLYNHRATRHSQSIIQRYAAMPQGGDIRSLPQELRTKKNNVFKLSDSSPSRTITCNFRTDILHPWHPRGLTTREAARLQSFDDDYQFFGNLTRKARYVTQDDQVGNAVPPLLALALAKHIKEHL